VTSLGATGDGATDDTVAIQRTIDHVAALGGGIVRFPAGDYLVNTSGGSFGDVSWALTINSSDVRLIFETGATLTTTADLSLIGIGPWIDDSFTSHWLGDPTNHTYYGIATAARDDVSITLSTPADAANFAAGDWVYIRTGSLNNSTVTEPDAEINRVASIAGGALTLAWPLSKPFVQEYFISGTTGKTSTAVTANTATFGVANITADTITNIRITGLDMDATGCPSARSAIVLRGPVVDIQIDGLTGTSAGSVYDGTEFRLGLFTDWNVTVDAPTTGLERWVGWCATGVTDVVIEDIVCQAVGDRFVYLHFHEGSSNVYAARITLDVDNGTVVNAGQGPLSVRARAYNHYYEDVTITSAGSYSAFVDDSCTDVTIVRPDITIEGAPTKGLRMLATEGVVTDPAVGTIVTYV
jgi:hypothetical protein